VNEKWPMILTSVINRQNRRNKQLSTSLRTVYDKNTLLEIMKHMTSEDSSLWVRDKKISFMKTYKSVFTGNEAVDWLAAKLKISREDAVQVGDQLTKSELIIPMKPNQPFRDEQEYYSASLAIQAEKRPEQIISLLSTRSFMDFHPYDVAQHLTMIEFRMFVAIELSELSHKAWSQPNRSQIASNVTSMIDRSNQVSFWVASQLVRTPNQHERIAVLKRFITIAYHCKKFNNFNTMMEIMGGLELSSIQRLKRTWAGLPSESVLIYEELTNLINPRQNFNHYRQALRTADPPMLPYIGIHLTWLTFIEENKTILDNGMVNYKKCQLLASTIGEIKKLQEFKFQFEIDPSLETYLLKDIVILSEKELYKDSQRLEPTSIL